MWKGYTYSETNGTYYCSARTRKKCKARVKLEKDGTEMLAQFEHYHPAPTYMVTASGQYIKIN